MLRQQSLVVTERDGPSVVYRLVDQRVITALDLMRQVMFDGLQRQSGLMEASALLNQPGGENGTA
jgi:hypothetical protein